MARVSGPEAIRIVQSVWQGRPLTEAATHTAHLGTIVDPEAGPLDQAVATVYRAPRSFTGDDVVELSVHGSPWIQRELINLLIRSVATAAEPGEFTRRAFAAGKLDLAEAEAVADMIASSSRAAHRIAISHMRGHYSRRLEGLRTSLLELCALLELELDFSEEDVEFASRIRLIELAREIHSTVTRMADSFASGAAIKQGISVAIVGPTNAGKSTLLNRLLGDERAIVSPIHGTTRDLVEDTVEISGRLFRFTDTAGLRHTTDPIESIGIDRSLQAMRRAQIILWLIDPTQPEAAAPELPEDATVIAVINKSDLPHPTNTEIPQNIPTVHISALNDADLTPLTDLLLQLTDTDTTPADMMVTNARHYQALTAASTSIARAIDGLTAEIPADLVAQDLRETLHHLSTITGAITTDTILQTIFTTFCKVK